MDGFFCKKCSRQVPGDFGSNGECFDCMGVQYSPKPEPQSGEADTRCYAELTGLVDRLQVCIEIKYPDRKWNSRFKEDVINEWKNKIDQLKERVDKLENEIKIRVCDKCFQSSCWQGLFLCEESYSAGTVDLTIKELKRKNTHEHWSYWIETYVDELIK